MARLSAQDLRSRLAYDARVCQGLSSPHLALAGYVSTDAIRAERVATEAEVEAGRAEYYMARFAFRMLRGAHSTISSATLVFNLMAGGSYPFSPPAVTITSRPLPWSPHVQSGSGLVCIGEAWDRSRGQMLLAQLVIHLMRVLNCDEPDRGHSYVGWNPEAARYWRDKMQCKPVNPGLQYPVLPVELTHGATSTPTFTAKAFPAQLTPIASVAPVAGFRSLSPSTPPSGGLFRAAPVVLPPSPTFRPRGGRP